MHKTVISTLALAALAFTSLTCGAYAQPRDCPTPIMKGGCPVVLTQTGPYQPAPQDD
jgi:hypothetical protein